MSIDLLEHVELEHLEGEQRQLAEAIGIEAYRQLVRKYAGTMLYVQTVDTVTRKARDNMIREEYNGYNVRDLATKYGISEQWVRNIVGPAVPPIDGQVGMFDGISEAI